MIIIINNSNNNDNSSYNVSQSFNRSVEPASGISACGCATRPATRSQLIAASAPARRAARRRSPCRVSGKVCSSKNKQINHGIATTTKHRHYLQV